MTSQVVEWAPCSDRSRERDDPLAATASRGLQWFLVEIEGSWGANAFTSTALGRELGQAIVHRVEAAGMRPLAIRRVARAAHSPAARPAQQAEGDAPAPAPARDDATSRATDAAHAAGGPSSGARKPRWRWAFVDSRPGFEQVRWGEVDAPQELLDVPLDGSTGIRSPDPVYCVCTHAKHDQCCAVHGRPVALALAEAYPEQTWECSHLGGDRFAGTMAIFPGGHYYGRADDAETVDIVRDYLDGRVDGRYYRGRSSLSHPAQAAQHYARLQLGDDRLASFAVVSERMLGADAPATTEVLLAAPAPTLASAADLAPVAAAAQPALVRVVVAETLSQPLLSTCAATRFGRVREYALISLAPPPP
ncbi:sucrase ferredoxin [Subtercola endophyticus]|uniref:sucrase ferredoxin n=1 Tax=Subtercola endophyticus TaxID=2895559 RepID=UPI001E630F7E|nr:sucrase ferredoxin [Subtercola endophyticus]UFS59644.1 sucrase ferredoxin [Subtercola endophyticus]